jgi:hypothetical protein
MEGSPTRTAKIRITTATGLNLPSDLEMPKQQDGGECHQAADRPPANVSGIVVAHGMTRRQFVYRGSPVI